MWGTCQNVGNITCQVISPFWVSNLDYNLKNGCLFRVKMIQSPKRESFSRVFVSPSPFLVSFDYSTWSSFFTPSSSQDTEIFERYRDLMDDQSKLELLSVLKLRYFTPREVANLHGFPSDFCKFFFFLTMHVSVYQSFFSQCNFSFAASTRDKNLISIQQIDSMLPCVCSENDHRWRQNATRG